ncbi:MAG: hypothetical protein Q9172_003196 [Xanthocarpia lactea]
MSLTGLSHKRTSVNSQVMLNTHVLRLLWSIALWVLLRALNVDASTLPPRAPKRPWDEYLCQNGRYRYPDFYLTYSEGAPRSGGAIHDVLEDAVRTLNLLIEEGDGDKNIPVPHYDITNIWETRMSLELWRRHRFGIRHTGFTVNQALAAVELMQWCGVMKGHYSEMWAYVFAGGKQIGYVFYHRVDVYQGRDGRNETAELSIS